MKLLLLTAHRKGEIGRGKNRLARLLAECRQVRRVWWRLIMAILIVVLIIHKLALFLSNTTIINLPLNFYSPYNINN
jgi:hypothetical protein